MNTITIIGAGGIGCALGVALGRAGWPIRFVDANRTKCDHGNRNGVQVVGYPAQRATFIPFADWQPDPNDWHLLCTKCYDNATVLAKLPPDATLIPVQNGFDPELDRRGHPVEGIASFVSECLDDEPITGITRIGDLHLGYRGNERPDWLKTLADAFTQGTVFRVKVVERIQPYKYTKLMYNAAISPIAAAAGIDNGDLLAIPSARRLFFGLLQENYRILRDANIELGQIGPFHPRTVARILGQRWLARLLAVFFTPSLRGTYCSMAPDLPRGRTEIAFYNGHLIMLAGDRPCPLNRAVVALIRRMEQHREAPNRSILGELTTVIDSP